MKNRYLKAFLTSCLSILPIVAIVLILSFTPLVNLGGYDYALFSVAGVILILGLSLFQIGAATGLSKVGEYMGSSLSQQKNIFVVIVFAFVLGALITCAEPSILIVMSDISSDVVTRYVIVAFISIGVGVFVVLGLLRVIKGKSLKIWYLVLYLIVFLLIIILQTDESKKQFLPFIFDSGGITTGSATVPFILAVGAGVATVRGGKRANEDSFGLVGMASIGPILTMTIYIIFASAGFAAYNYTPVSSADGSFMNHFLIAMIPSETGNGTLLDVLIALAPIVLIFFIYEAIFIKLPKKRVYSLLIGFVFAYVGLVLFLTGTNGAMGNIGKMVGEQLGGQNNAVIIVLSFVLGLVTILCEPAVHALTAQIEEISDGHIKKSTVLLTLSLGVGVAICLSVIRTLYQFSIMYYIVPLYAVALLLMFCVPNIYVAIAFDSGGTASGPMSTSFILPLVIGLAHTRFSADSLYNGYYQDAFGVVALIAVTPIIAIQLLGLISGLKVSYANHLYRQNLAKEGNDEIIHFC